MNSSSFNARKRSRPWNPFSRHHSGELPQVKANPKKNNELNESKGDSSLLSLIASMTKSLMDSCALSLSSGIAIYGNSPKAIFAGIFWIFWLSLVFGFFCWLIAHLCQLTGSTTIRGIWQSTVGPKGAYLVSLANTFKAALSSWAYATILSDLLQTLLLETWGYSVPRWFCLTGVTTFGIVPLCMLDHLNSLAPFFIVGSAGIIFTAVSMGIRYCDGSYREGGMYYNELPADYKPQFGTENHPWSFAILPFCCMTYEAFVMHYNSARFYTCLQDRNLSRFAFAVGCSFGLSALTYMGIAVFGFLTFGSGSSEDILSNYNPKDKLIMISRLGVGISTLVSTCTGV